jgi:hypothetical protein
VKTEAKLTGMWGEIELSELVRDTRAHLPVDEKYKFWADRRLAELCLVIERLMPFGSIEIERPQPAFMYALVYRENGKRHVALSFDGPPTQAYVRLIKDDGEISKLRSEIASVREENEVLMNIDYWPDRARAAEKKLKECEELIAKLKERNP